MHKHFYFMLLVIIPLLIISCKENNEEPVYKTVLPRFDVSGIEAIFISSDAISSALELYTQDSLGSINTVDIVDENGDPVLGGITIEEFEKAYDLNDYYGYLEGFFTVTKSVDENTGNVITQNYSNLLVRKADGSIFPLPKSIDINKSNLNKSGDFVQHDTAGNIYYTDSQNMINKVEVINGEMVMSGLCEHVDVVEYFNSSSATYYSTYFVVDEDFLVFVIPELSFIAVWKKGFRNPYRFDLKEYAIFDTVNYSTDYWCDLQGNFYVRTDNRNSGTGDKTYIGSLQFDTNNDTILFDTLLVLSGNKPLYYGTNNMFTDDGDIVKVSELGKLTYFTFEDKDIVTVPEFTIYPVDVYADNGKNIVVAASGNVFKSFNLDTKVVGEYTFDEDILNIAIPVKNSLSEMNRAIIATNSGYFLFNIDENNIEKETDNYYGHLVKNMIGM